MAEVNTKKRIEWVDTVKFLCMIFIMLHHMGYVPEAFVAVYLPFVLTMLFFVSGYVYKQVDFKTFITKKFLTLILPWFIYGCVMLAFNCALSRDFSTFLNDFLWMLAQIRNLNDKLYFMPLLFVSFIPFYFTVKYLSKKAALISVGALAVLSVVLGKYLPVFPWGNNCFPWHLQLIFIVELFLLLGYYYKGEAEEKCEKFVKWRFALPALLIYVLLTVGVYRLTGDIYGLGYYGNGKIYTIPLFFVIEAVGTVTVIALVKLIKINRFIAFVGQNTILYYIFHIEIEKFLCTIFRRIFFGDSLNDYYIIIDYVIEPLFGVGTAASEFFISVTVVAVSVFYVLLTQAVLILPFKFIRKYLPFTLGNIKKKK